MSTFNKIYKKVANNGNSDDYQVVGQVGVNGVPLDIMKGANSSSAGEIGLVPKPVAGDNNRYLRSDGIWSVPPDTNTTYGVFTGSNNGLVPSTDKSTYFLTGNGSWGYPWIGSWSESGKTLICLGSGDDQLSKNEIPEATSSSNGLMSSKDKSRLDSFFINSEFSSSSETTAWTPTDPNKEANMWPFTIYPGNTNCISVVNGSTINIEKNGIYFIYIRLQYNTKGKRIYAYYKLNGEYNSSNAITIASASDRMEWSVYSVADHFNANDKVQFFIKTQDSGSSLSILPIETHIYTLPWV